MSDPDFLTSSLEARESHSHPGDVTGDPRKDLLLPTFNGTSSEIERVGDVLISWVGGGGMGKGGVVLAGRRGKEEVGMRYEDGSGKRREVDLLKRWEETVGDAKTTELRRGEQKKRRRVSRSSSVGWKEKD